VPCYRYSIPHGGFRLGHSLSTPGFATTSRPHLGPYAMSEGAAGSY
jgi:hypothetical protein